MILRKRKQFYSNSVKKPVSVALAMFLCILAAVPIFLYAGPVHAVSYNQITNRSIKLSTSAPGATNVTYTVGFTTSNVAAYSLYGIVINFCDNDPIIGDACTYTGSGQSINTTSVTVGSETGISGFTVDSTGTNANTVVLKNAGGASVNSTAITFNLSNITNPNYTSACLSGSTNPENCTFYARILTYTSVSGAESYVAGTPGAVQDAGGVALSTAQQISITAKVQEQITFCLYISTAAFNSQATAGDGGNCSGTGSSIALGNKYGILSAIGPYVDLGTHYDIQSNAGGSGGVVIRFEGAPLSIGNLTTCGTSTTGCIESSTASGTGATATTGYTSTPSSQQFGLCTFAVGGTYANLTPAGPYSDSTNCTRTNVNLLQTSGPSSTATGGDGGAAFGFNIANAASTYGDTLATFPNPGSYVTGDIAFIGNISNTTPAGYYTTTLTFIATGTY